MFRRYFLALLFVFFQVQQGLAAPPAAGGAGYALTFDDQSTSVFEWILENVYECDVTNRNVTCEMSWTWWQLTLDDITDHNSISFGIPANWEQLSFGNRVLIFAAVTVPYGEHLDTNSIYTGGNDGLWHHFGVTWSSQTLQLDFYMDGKWVVSQDYNDYVDELLAFISPSYLVIGQEQDAALGGYDASQAYRGQVDDVKIWSRVLSEEEVHTDMTRPPSANDQSGLLVHWAFDELPVDYTVTDTTGHGYVANLGDGVSKIQDSSGLFLTQPTFAPSMIRQPLGSFISVIVDPTQEPGALVVTLYTDETADSVEVGRLPACCTLHSRLPVGGLGPALMTGESVPLDQETGEYTVALVVVDGSALTTQAPWDEGSYFAVNSEGRSEGTLRFAQNRAPVLTDPALVFDMLESHPPKRIMLAGHDPDGQMMSAHILSIPSAGHLYEGIVTPDGYVLGDLIHTAPHLVETVGRLVWFLPVASPELNGNFEPYADFTYELRDPNNATSEVGSVTFNVLFENNPPEARDMNISTDEDTPVNVTLQGYDAEGISMLYMVTELPRHGTLVLEDEETALSQPFATWEQKRTIEQWVSAVPVYNYTTRSFNQVHGYPLEFGSEYDVKDWGAVAFVGPPDQCDAGICWAGCSSLTYAARQTDGLTEEAHTDAFPFRDQDGDGFRDEFIDLYFDTPVRVSGITFYEGYNPGVGVQLDLLDQSGQWDTVWTSDPQVGTPAPGILEVNICQRPYMTQVIRLHFLLDAVKGWNCMDAVLLKGETEVKPGFVVDPRTSRGSNRITYVPDPDYYGSDSFSYTVNDCLQGSCEERQGYPTVTDDGSCPLDPSLGCTGTVHMEVRPTNDGPLVQDAFSTVTTHGVEVEFQGFDKDPSAVLSFHIAALHGLGKLFYKDSVTGGLGSLLPAQLPTIVTQEVQHQAVPPLTDLEAGNSTLATLTLIFIPNLSAEDRARFSSGSTPTLADLTYLKRDFVVEWGVIDSEGLASPLVNFTEEVVCDAGMYLNSLGFCLECPLGHFMNTTNREPSCYQCPPGMYQSKTGRTDCLLCNDLPASQNFYNDRYNASECVYCPDNTARLGGMPGLARDECTCKEGYWQPEGLQNGAECVACPDGAICLGTHQDPQEDVFGSNWEPYPDENFWGSKTDRSLFLECEEGTCLGGVDFECQVGYTQRLCSECAPGYWSAGDACDYRCNNNWQQALLMIALTSMVLMLWLAMNKVVSDEHDSLDLLLAYLQVGDIISGFELRWTPAVTTVQEILSVVNFEVDVVAIWKCYMTWSYTWSFGLQLVLPVIVATHTLISSIPVLYYYFRWGRGVKDPPSKTVLGYKITENGMHTGMDDIITVIFSFLLVCYNNLCIFSFITFVCVEGPDDTQLLAAGPSVECWQGEHLVQVAVSLAGVCVYVVGVPAFFTYILFSGMKNNRMAERHFLSRYGFIYSRYKVEYAWWELLLMFRNFSMCFVLVFFSQDPVLQSMLGLMVLGIAGAAQAYARPFRQDRLNMLDFLGLVGNAFYIMCGILMNTEKELYRLPAQYAIFCIIIGVTLCGLFTFYLDLRDQFATTWAGKNLLSRLSRQLLVNPEAALGPVRHVLQMSERAFDDADKDGDGELNWHEVKNALMKNRDVEDATVDKFMALVDRDGSSAVSRVELRMLFMRRLTNFVESRIKHTDVANVKAITDRHMSVEDFPKMVAVAKGIDVDKALLMMPTTPKKLKDQRTHRSSGSLTNLFAKTPRRSSVEADAVPQRSANSLVDFFSSTLGITKDQKPRAARVSANGKLEGNENPAAVVEASGHSFGKSGAAEAWDQITRQITEMLPGKKTKGQKARMLRVLGRTENAKLTEEELFGLEGSKEEIIRELVFTLHPRALKAWALSKPSAMELRTFHAIDSITTPFFSDTASQSAFQLDQTSVLYRRFVAAFPFVIDWLVVAATDEEAEGLKRILDSLIDFYIKKGWKVNDPKGDYSQLIVGADKAPLATWLMETDNVNRTRAKFLLKSIHNAWKNFKEEERENAPVAKVMRRLSHVGSTVGRGNLARNLSGGSRGQPAGASPKRHRSGGKSPKSKEKKKHHGKRRASFFGPRPDDSDSEETEDEEEGSSKKKEGSSNRVGTNTFMNAMHDIGDDDASNWNPTPHADDSPEDPFDFDGHNPYAHLGIGIPGVNFREHQPSMPQTATSDVSGEGDHELVDFPTPPESPHDERREEKEAEDDFKPPSSGGSFLMFGKRAGVTMPLDPMSPSHLKNIDDEGVHLEMPNVDDLPESEMGWSKVMSSRFED